MTKDAFKFDEYEIVTPKQEWRKGWTTSAVVALSVVITIVVATLCTTLTYFLHPNYTGSNSENPFQPDPSDPVPESRVNCIPERDQDLDYTKELCLSRGCLWKSSYSGEPWCFFPDKYGAYEVVYEEIKDWGTRLRMDRMPNLPSFFENDISTIIIDIEYQTEERLHFKIYDPKSPRFEVPIDMPPRPNTRATEPTYKIAYTLKPFTLTISRASSGEILWDTSIGALIFEDQFVTISTRLPSTNIYGFGESEHNSFKHDMNWQTWGLFARDQPPTYKANLYGVHPFYTCLEYDTNAHGVLLLNANAQDVTLQPSPALTYHTIGGVLDFYMFLGPTPENVVQQYTEVIGRTMMPPYWSLGYQLCRYGYGNLSNMQDVVNSMREYDIPHDVQYADIDYMERQLDFTIDPVNYVGLGDYVEELKSQGTRFVIILDPAISGNETDYLPFDEGVKNRVFIEDENENIVYGKVWPDYPNVTINSSLEWDDAVRLYRAYAALPDFRKQSTQEWWRDQMTQFKERVNFDGIWIDMNEPANFVHGSVDGCTDNTYDNPPFLPDIWGATIHEKTICMNSVQHVTTITKDLHYNMHNLYGWSQCEPTLNITRSLTGQRSLVISRSTFPSSGKYIGHWLGDNASIWPHLHYSIIGMLEFNLFGIPYIGADICGFFDDTAEDLCRRWHQVGAFYPYARNHNTLGTMPQHPAYFGERFALEVRDVLHIRYRLLPYLYTLFYQSHTQGSTVVRSLMHEFTSDSITWDIDRQFMWGPALLISPVLEFNTTTVRAYFPAARWYDYYDGMEVPEENLEVGGGVDLETPLDRINLHFRGGHIIPTQRPANSTMFSRLNPFGLIVALDDSMAASGSLFWDDGESIDSISNEEYYLFQYSFANNVLTGKILVSQTGLMDGLKMDEVTIHGIEQIPSNVELNGVTVTFDFSNTAQVLNVTSLGHPMGTDFTLTIT